jgi:hypothetical protein
MEKYQKAATDVTKTRNMVYSGCERRTQPWHTDVVMDIK